jgi:hypothetical protein
MPTNPFKSLNEPEDVSLPQRNVESINEPTPPPSPPDVDDVRPVLDFLEPGSCMIGDADFTLFVHGTNFFSSSVIHFAGHDEPSMLNVDGTLSTGVKPSLWASPVVVEVKVRNGALTSAPLPFEFLSA